MLTSQPENHHLYDPEKVDNDHYHQLPDISDEAMLRMLLRSSKQLDFGPEIPPIVALQTIQAHERVLELTLEDFKELTDKLYRYMNCYGWASIPFLPIFGFPALFLTYSELCQSQIVSRLKALE